MGKELSDAICYSSNPEINPPWLFSIRKVQTRPPRWMDRDLHKRLVKEHGMTDEEAEVLIKSLVVPRPTL